MSFRSESLVGPAGAASHAVRRTFAFVTDGSEAGAARRLAASAFLARVFNAGIGFATQILLARWMGDRDYGIYAYVWVWLLLAGGIGSLGLPVAALKFIPDYTARGDMAGLRGFLRAARSLALLPCMGGALLAGLVLAIVTHGEGTAYLPVALIGLAVLPVYVLMDIQTGIARAYDYVDLGLAADYLLRPALLLAFSGLVWLSGLGGTAVNVMAATLASVAVTALVQGIVLQRRLLVRIPPGPQRLDLRRWMEVSWPLLIVTSFTLLLGSTDILVLKLFVGPEEIALYFAATKIVAIASFVSYGVSNTSAHRFAEHMALADRAGMADLAAQTVRWTFWPTLGVALVLALLGAPLLSLFGTHFSAGYPIVAILGLGLVLGAAVGPADRALAMADHGRVTAWIYGASFVANLFLALLLIPPLGLSGAALATALATGLRAAMLYGAARSRLGLDMFVLSPARLRTAAADGNADALSAEILRPEEAERIAAEWRDLADRALEPNVFYTPELALAGMRHLPGGGGVRLVAVWRGTGTGRRLVGALPILPARRRYLNVLPVRRAAGFYGTLSTPLVDPDRPGETLRAMLRALARHGQVGLVLPFLHPDGTVAATLDEICARDGLQRAILGTHQRAMLRSPLPGGQYIRATLETRRRKEADRQRRRLAEEGELVFRVARGPDEIAAAFGAFIRIEAAGWKGRAGTALVHAPGAEAFFREAALALSLRGEFRIGTLSLDGLPVAVGLLAEHGRRAFYVKTAYDENFARFSPGLLLTLDLTAHLLDDHGIADADSIAVADHPMIDRIWTERFAVTSIVVATRPGGGAAFRAAVAMERRREQAVSRLKRIRLKLRRSRQSAGKDDHNKSATEAGA
ncbi:GNAT family N-acetyltransferase [Enterovirga aerilata]|uniref:GNAT family N-acetyltransferase n=1 Tax=Enterovirga aerilata TaxID=2730920 RepID=A0A849IER8_9HYPH|nr:GNAT family N-acetyltransferase [Enterovirga sp. DB1703]NNM72373.1 GNAT family N-acetyltransferase [Enterovirga sp. DB1703]